MMSRRGPESENAAAPDYDAAPLAEREYHAAVQDARERCEPFGENRGSEYARGMIELIADLWAKPGVETGERAEEVERDIFECTGTIDGDGILSHDSHESCPVHEVSPVLLLDGDALQRIEGAYKSSYPDDLGNPENFVANVLTDLRHFCDTHELNFGHIDRQAYEAYLRDFADNQRKAN